MASFESDNLHLTDFLDISTLQEIQDGFAAVANVRARITDAEGNVLTQPVPTADFINRQEAIAAAEAQLPGPQKEGREYVAPITVNNQRLGTVRMSPNGAATFDETKLAQLSEKFGLDAKQLKSLITQLTKSRDSKPAAIQFLFMLANAIARLCYQEYQLRQRINELTAVYNVTMMLADARNLDRVLKRTVEVVSEVMECKASSIRLVDAEHDELVIKAVHNLSEQYVNKGPVLLSTSDIDRGALSPKGYEYVRDMSTDPRVHYPQDVAREGIVSMLSVGMRYKGKPIGALRVYTEKEQTFSQLKIDLLKAIAAQAAAAIENARLLEESLAAERLEKQVAMAADVQQRMIPQDPPKFAHVDFSSVYVPCFELGGDFYDFIPLPDNNVGLVMADVSGKGVAASLIMAAVRAALRAQVDNVYYLYEVVRRLNVMIHRDTKPGEFLTLFYGVLDTNTRRLTYCNAGHPPALVYRDGKIIELSSENMVLGIDPAENYKQSIFDLRPNDLLLLYTDGLSDAMNFADETFGRQRIHDAFTRLGPTADAETVAQNILWEVRKFAGIAKRTDDITMVVAKMT
jgi:phosphoserine phosphatase RsbU/P